MLNSEILLYVKAAMAKGPVDAEGSFKMRFPGVQERVSSQTIISTKQSGFTFWKKALLYLMYFLQVIFPGTNPGQSNNAFFNPADELPKTVARTLNQGSVPTSMDFHPVQQTLILGLFSQT